jgi:hypothetical protein
MHGRLLSTVIALRRLAGLALILCVGLPGMAAAQTPSPLQEWQYPGGTILEKLYEPNTKDWRVVLGAALISEPRYDGGLAYHVTPGPVIVVLIRILLLPPSARASA